MDETIYPIVLTFDQEMMDGLNTVAQRTGLTVETVIYMMIAWAGRNFAQVLAFMQGISALHDTQGTDPQ